MTVADDEFADVCQWLRDPSVREFVDPHHRRLVDTYEAQSSEAATAVELGVLLRQLARRWPERAIAIGDELADLIKPVVKSLDLSLLPAARGELVLRAQPWYPAWIAGAEAGVATDASVDASACAGTRAGKRQRFDAFDADAAFTDATGYETYRTPGQRAAVRIALEGRPDGLLLTCLPTGSGKTEVAVTLARKVNGEGKTSLLIVPTTALAYDLERRFRATWSKNLGLDLSTEPFAWTAVTDDDDKRSLIERIQNGTQPVLITSPESLTTSLLGTVRMAAGTGRVGALVIDEAHLVTQWGMGFRPQYRLLGDLWRELNRRCPEGHGVRALLMSATYSRGVVDDLLELFLAGTDIEPDFVVANELRPEPDFWVADLTTIDERDRRIVEAVRRLPRPAIIYVTKPKQADRVAKLLRSEGFKRLAIVSGETGDNDRREAMVGLRTDEGASRYDLVVATSAFGLGVDCPEVRAVVHACLPESPDRWYQELGRGGRDGHRSTALLLPAYGDKDEAGRLSLRALTPEIAAPRWESMWDLREPRDDGNVYVCLAATPVGKQDGSYNRRWNQQILDALQSCEVLSAAVVPSDDLPGLGLEWSAQTPANLAPVWFRVTLHGSPPTPEWFEGPWVDWKEAVEGEDERELRLMRELLHHKGACSVLRSAYGQQRPAFANLYPGIAFGLGIRSQCGRCQACRDAGTVGYPAGDRPEAQILASTSEDTAFARLIAGHEFTGARAIGLDCPAVAVAVGELEPVADQLLKAGARLFVGPSSSAVATPFPFRDPPGHLESLIPLPAVVQLDRVDDVEAALCALSLRPKHVAPVLLIVPDIPRSVRTTAPLKLTDLIERMR